MADKVKHGPLVVPGPLAIARHSWPKVLEGKIIPLVLFLGFLDLLGTTGALLAALGWSIAVVVYRLSTGSPVPGLVVLSTIGLAAKTALALATGSLVVYFLQPTITTALVGLAFLASVPLKRPLAEKLAHDFCPFDADTAEHPMLRLFFLRLSLLWAFTSLVNAGFTLWLLLTQEVTTFVLIKSFTGPTFTAATLGIAVLWFRRRMKSAGFQLHFGTSMTLGSAA
ncbi:MAG: VC0807 family protein [Acidimicrobiales bacterium]